LDSLSFSKESPESKREFDVWVDEPEYLDKNPNEIDEKEHILTIKWQDGKLGKQDEPVTISVWAYQELYDLYPEVVWIADIVPGVPNTGEYKLDLNNLPQLKLDHYEYHFGFLGVNKTGAMLTMTEWTQPIPLGWLLRQYWRVEFGQKWQYNFCNF